MDSGHSGLARARLWFERGLAGIVITLLVAMTVLVTAAVVFRKAGHSLVWYDEVASVLLAWLTYYGAALAALKRSHIGFSGVIEAMSPTWRVPAVILSEAIIIGFFLLLGIYGIQVLTFLTGLTLVSLPWVPITVTQSVIPIGAALFIIAELMNMPAILAEAREAG